MQALRMLKKKKYVLAKVIDGMKFEVEENML